MRKRALKRHYDNVKKKRKIRIIKDCYGGKERLEHMKTGKLVKGKVHCSCYMCSPKSKTHGLKHSDKKNYQRGKNK